MKSKKGTKQVSDNDESSVDETRRPPRSDTTNLAPGSALSGMVSATNNTVLGQSPAVTIAGAYLGMGLASQLGFFSNANQYQNHSTMALAAVVSAIKRQMPTSGASQRRENLTTEKSAQPAPAEPSTENQDFEYAMREAEKIMQEYES
ncbi:MAG: hypothetical protein PVF13_05980 [Chromatiales bacterium]